MALVHAGRMRPGVPAVNDIHGINLALWIVAGCSVIALLKSFGVFR